MISHKLLQEASVYSGLRGRIVRSHSGSERARCRQIRGQIRGGLKETQGSASWPELPLTQCGRVRKGKPSWLPFSVFFRHSERPGVAVLSAH